jgi:hypothetical protein
MHDLVCKACTDTGLVRSTKGRIFNKMLHVRHVHFTKGQAYLIETNPPSRQTVCHIRIMAARVQSEKISGRESQGSGAPRSTDWRQTASQECELLIVAVGVGGWLLVAAGRFQTARV